MTTLDQIEKQVEQLPIGEKKALLQWLEDLLEDELEFTEEFKAIIERAKRDIAQGRGRVVKPGRGGRAGERRPAFTPRSSMPISPGCQTNLSGRSRTN